jgi:hypothetical protein
VIFQWREVYGAVSSLDRQRRALLKAETATAPPIAASASMTARTRFFIEDFMVQPQAAKTGVLLMVETATAPPKHRSRRVAAHAAGDGEDHRR